jgi:hypothetical protein
MPIRIEIELTSAAPDGSWTWRAAGARQPRGVLDGSILPSGASVGDQLKVETEQNLDGIQVLSVVPGKEKAGRTDLLELLPSSEKFEPVVEHRAPRTERGGGRGPRRDGERGDRRDRRRDDRGPRPDGPPRGARRPLAGRGQAGDAGGRRAADGRGPPPPPARRRLARPR